MTNITAELITLAAVKVLASAVGTTQQTLLLVLMLLPVVFVACSKHQIPTLIPTDDFIQTSKMQRGNVKVREGGGGFWQGGSWKFGTSECRGAKTQQNLGT